MQTFLPFSDFQATAECLDYRRLGKQRVEAMQLLDLLVHPNKQSRWRNHPALKMWEGHAEKLATYAIVMCREWIARGYKDTCLPKICALVGWEILPLGAIPGVDSIIQGMPWPAPEWLGDLKLHLSHQSNLLRKQPAHYKNYFVNVPPNMPYVWPYRGNYRK